MKILTCNVRGLNAPNKWSLIRCHLEVCQVEVCLLQETKLDCSDLVNFGKNMKLWKWVGVEVEGALGGLIIIWKAQSVLVETLNSS